MSLNPPANPYDSRTVDEFPHIFPLPWNAAPARVLARWPSEHPLAVLWSGGGNETHCAAAPLRSRWTILASPVRTLRIPSVAPDPLGAISLALGSTALANPTHDRYATNQSPFLGGWIGALSYELGRTIEPTASHGNIPSSGDTSARGWPDVLLHHCPAAYLHDARTGSWSVVGHPDARACLPDEQTLLGSEPAGRGAGFRVGVPTSSMSPAAYRAAVARTIEYIHAGDIFQANIAHRLTADFAGSSRACFAAMAAGARPWYGAYLEDHDGTDGLRRALCSMSPELFLELDHDRTVTTRPIKGTRSGGADPRLLRESPKDQAELTMIVDLMRNDLGRVCEFGSIRVPELRVIERHGGDSTAGVQHGVATVQGRLREGVSIADLLRATFPGGSITGAPKVRAMQIIDELEPVERGVYTGCIGFFSDCGRMSLNIAIRTGVITGRAAPGAALDAFERASLDYAVGAGIVAESDPESEWQETLAKAGALLRVVGVHEGGEWEGGLGVRVAGRPVACAPGSFEPDSFEAGSLKGHA